MSRAEIDHFRLVEKFGATKLGQTRSVTREDFERAIAERMFDFKKRSSWYNPERSPGDYSAEQGGTRVFHGPRIPGRGIYFEETAAFPKRLKGGALFPPGAFESPHWTEKHENAWASWRGSFRDFRPLAGDISRWGRMVIGEEGQSDYMQGAQRFADDTERRPRISEEEYLERKAEADRSERVIGQAGNCAQKAAAVSVFNRDVSDTDRREYRSKLSPSYDHKELAPDEWRKVVEEVRRRIREAPGSEAHTGLMALERLEALRSENERFFAPGAREKYTSDLSKYTSATPIDETYVRNMVRQLLLIAARKGADSVAIATSETTDRIQANTHRSAAHFYDNQLKPALERELQRWMRLGTPVTLDLVQLPKAMGAPRNEKPYTVWATRLSPELKERIRREGLPMLSVDRRNSFSPAYRARIPEAVAAVERELRRMLPEHVTLRLLPYVRAPGPNVPIAGMYDSFSDIVSVALANGPREAKVKGLHEIAAHALRGGTASLYKSLYTAEEWRLLVEKAKDVNAEASLTSPIAGLPPMEGYRRTYARYARSIGLKGDARRRWVAELLDQERVGALAEQWASGTDFGQKVNALLARIIEFLDAVRNALRGLGFQTYEDVFERVVSGAVAERGNERARGAAEEARKADEEIDRSWPEMREAALEAARRRWPQAETQETRARDAYELPDVDGMDTFELRHLAKDLGLPDNLWRGRRAAEIRNAIKKRQGRRLHAVSRRSFGSVRRQPHARGLRTRRAAWRP